ncbi:phosphatase PAP2 family protein [Lentibacillus halophilus]|uniref:phosphatase PAP2 family protein n=1 Tax=Lentibacillus halophilus TaxID=295065 RepID=UPI003CD0BD0A
MGINRREHQLNPRKTEKQFRLYVGHHYPTDVIAGIIVGIVSTYLCPGVYNRISHNKHQRTSAIYIDH